MEKHSWGESFSCSVPGRRAGGAEGLRGGGLGMEVPGRKMALCAWDRPAWEVGRMATRRSGAGLVLGLNP